MRKNGKHTLVIDGNFFLFRTLHVLPPPTKAGEILGTKADIATYIRKLSTDLCYQLRQFEGLIDQVVWTLDSRSWRKDFYPEAEYKGNRKASTVINWENFSAASDEFKTILAKKGVIISKVDGAEGDDLIYAWNTECLANEKSVIMFTGDRDLIQLVSRNDSNGSHTILYSPIHKKLYTYQGFSEWLNTETQDNGDIFDVLKNQINVEEQVKKHLKTVTKNVEIVEVNTIDFSFTKVLTGDTGDNVLSAYWYVLRAKDGTQRRYGISDAKAQKITDEFKKKHGPLNILYLFNQDYIDDLANHIVKIMNAKHMSKETIVNNLNANINLMILNAKTIPESILDDMFKNIEPIIGKCVADFTTISTMNKLLEGTEYVKAPAAVAASFFKNDDDDDADFSFIKDKKNKSTIF
jgi:5'-3' exonuclease